jgi:hypothetical protein
MRVEGAGDAPRIGEIRRGEETMIGKRRIPFSGPAGRDGHSRRQGQEAVATFTASGAVKMIGGFGGIKQ